MRRIFKNQKGFTLLETLVALTIIAIGLLAVATMQSVAINANSIANTNSVASTLAQHVAEDLLSTSITGTILTTGGGPYTYMLDKVNNTNQITIPGSGTYTATYTTTINALATGTTKVVVKVTYISNASKTIGVLMPVTTFTTFKRAI